MGAEVTASLPVRNAGKTLNGISIQGVTPNITQLTTLKVATGREFNGTDDELRRNVCIIGADVARTGNRTGFQRRRARSGL